MCVFGFPHSSVGKEFPCNAGDLGLIPGLGRSPGEVKGYSLQYSDLEYSMDCTVHGVAKSWISLSEFHLVLTLSVSIRNVKIQNSESSKPHFSCYGGTCQTGIFTSITVAYGVYVITAKHHC